MSSTSNGPDGRIPQAPAYGSIPTPPAGYDGRGAGMAPPPLGAPGGYAAPAPQSNGLAIAALVCGILSIPGVCCQGWGGVLLGIAAIVLAVMARKKAAQGLARRSVMSIVGMVLGIIGLLLGIGMVILGLVLGPKLAACDSKRSDPTAYQQCVVDQLGIDATVTPSAPATP